MYGIETMFPVSFIFKPFAYMERSSLMPICTGCSPPFMLISPPSRRCRRFSGGYPSFQCIQCERLSCSGHQTSKAIGRFFIRSLPVMVHSPIVLKGRLSETAWKYLRHQCQKCDHWVQHFYQHIGIVTICKILNIVWTVCQSIQN